MSDASDESPKVVSLFGAPIEAAPMPKAAVDASIVTLLETFLQYARDGQLNGIVLAAFTPDEQLGLAFRGSVSRIFATYGMVELQKAFDRGELFQDSSTKHPG